jgi:hypothetical protein
MRNSGAELRVIAVGNSSLIRTPQRTHALDKISTVQKVKGLHYSFTKPLEPYVEDHSWEHIGNIKCCPKRCFEADICRGERLKIRPVLEETANVLLSTTNSYIHADNICL